jgi:DHA1 family inner membrane transport protein
MTEPPGAEAPAAVTDNPADRPVSIAAAIFIGVVGVAIFMVQPVYLGALADHLQFSSEQLGLIAGVEISGSALAGIGAFFWVGRWNWRIVGTICLSFIFIGNMISAWTTDFQVMLVVRFLTGFLGLGTAFVLSVAAVSATTQLHRNFSFTLVAQVSIGILGLSLLPAQIATWGPKAVFLPIALFALLLLPALRLLPRSRAKAANVQTTVTEQSRLTGWLTLGCQWILYSGIGGVWAFVERLGVDAGIENTAIGNALAVGMAVGLVGAFAAAATADRFGRILPFATAMLLQILSIWWLADITGYNRYVVAVTVFNIGWNLALPYLFGVAAIADTRGRIVVLMPTAQTTGLVVGSIIAGLVIGRFGIDAVLYQGAIAVLLAVIIYAVVATKIAAQRPLSS